MSRDRHWSAKGTHKDYDRLRSHAKKVANRAPSYVDQEVVNDIADKGSRRFLAENVHKNSFLDGLAWSSTRFRVARGIGLNRRRRER